MIELLVVIAIVGLLAGFILVSLNAARDKARMAVAAQNQRQLQKATEMYVSDIGFYPPDVNRGWDPGFGRALPYNTDLGTDCATNSEDCPSCPQCPSDWKTIVQNNWRGPYIVWPPDTPWKGEYDYNYWPSGASRYGCSVGPGIYIGVQRNYNDQNGIPPAAEQRLLDEKLDSDGCFNGESQMILMKL